MTETQKKAIERIDKDFDTKKLKNNYAKVIGEPTAHKIKYFCEDSNEFADFVLNAEETITDCIEAVSQEIKGNKGVSDCEVYTKAVQYYFPTATVEIKMHILLEGNAEGYAMTEGQGGVGGKKSEKITLSMGYNDFFGGL